MIGSTELERGVFNMDFYESIADFYDLIFPFSPGQAEFVRRRMAEVPGPLEEKRILDIGCGTGALAAELGREGFHVVAVDYDEEMIARARERGGADFRSLDMRRIDSEFQGEIFHGVFCFGNTLVHLTDPADIADFVRKAATLLIPGGRIAIQIINYDRILDQDVRGLPTIESDRIRFQRDYFRDDVTGLIDFHTVLTVKSSGLTLENSVPLYPLRRDELLGYMRGAGFQDIREYGGFDEKDFSPDSIPLIVTGSR